MKILKNQLNSFLTKFIYETFHSSFLSSIILLQISCTNENTTERPKSYHGQDTFKSLKTETEQQAFAKEAAQKFIIVDGHVDLPYRLKVKNFRLEKEFFGISVQSDEGDFDFVRARAGGLDAPFMSIYIPSSFQETGGTKLYADLLTDIVNTMHFLIHYQKKLISTFQKEYFSYNFFYYL